MHRFVWIALLNIACQGALELEDENGMATGRDQGLPFPDMANAFDLQEDSPSTMLDQAIDIGEEDACETTVCGSNATCHASGACECNPGFVGDPAVGCAVGDPCAGISCSFGATCNAGICVCDAGFNTEGAGCVQITPGNTAARSEQQVCDRWRADHPTQSQQMWQVEPADMCDPGVLHPVVLTDALRRTSLFRWLVGLPGVTSMPQYGEITQECATTLAASNRGLSHSLDATYTCFTQAAAQGAGSSNLARGVSHPASSVDLYVGDNGVRSLGHRRWIFNPRMGATGFGQRGSYSCMYAFDSSVSPNPEYVAYPAPGYFPRNALIGYWSFGSTQLSLNGSTVSMLRTDTNEEVAVDDVYFPGGGFGIPVVAWRVPQAQNNVEYEITVTLPNAETRTYRTTLVTCN